MKKINGAQVVLGALNLLAAGGAMVSGQVYAQTFNADQNVEVLNAVSLGSMESSWLKVPVKCKARGFNAEAISSPRKELRTEIQDIYSSFEV